MKKADADIKCYFSQDISRAYRNTCNKGEKLSHGFAYQCYYCNKFFVRPDKHKRHMEHCSCVPGIVYNFNSQNLVTSEDNLGCKGDLPVVAYIDFETTAPTDSCFEPKQKKGVCCIVCYNIRLSSKIKMNRIIIQCSFWYSLEQLTTINYLTNSQIPFVNINSVKQLKDCALEVSQKNVKMPCKTSHFVLV